MESSEDDAGWATSARRGASARESDPEQMEDVSATPEAPPPLEASEPARSCASSTMSEDNLDGVSVSSPSTQDGNTSTEAILDMIDEFVDGPGAPRRLPLDESHLAPVPISSDSSQIKTITEQATSSDQDPKKDIPDDQQVIPDVQQDSLRSPSSTTQSEGMKLIVSTSSSQQQTEVHIDSIVSTNTTEAVSCSMTENEEVSAITTPDVKIIEAFQSLDSKQHFLQAQTSTADIKTNKSEFSVDNNKVKSLSCVEELKCNATDEVSTSEIDNANQVTSTQASPNPMTELSSLKMPSSSTVQEVDDCRPVSMEMVNNEKQDSDMTTHKCDTNVKQNLIPSSEEVESRLNTSCDSSNAELDESLSSPALTTLEVEVDNSKVSNSVLEEHSSSEKKILSNASHISSLQVDIPISNATDDSESNSQKQTVPSDKCSENVDNVTLKSVEHLASVPSTKSPLKRKLVRPPRSEPVNITTLHSQTNTQSTVPISVCASSPIKEVSNCSSTIVNIDDKKVDETIINKIESTVTPKKIKLIRYKVSSSASRVDSSNEIKIHSEQQPTPSAKVEEVLTHREATDVTNAVNCSSSTAFKSSNTDKEVPITSTEDIQSKIKEMDEILPTKSETVTMAEAVSPQTPALPKPKEISKTIDSVSTLNETNTNVEFRKVPPIKLNIATASSTVEEPSSGKEELSSESMTSSSDSCELEKQVPKLTIKLGNKTSEESKSSVPKLTIKPLRSPTKTYDDTVPEIKPIVTKLNIKPIPKLPETVNDVHRRSSSSEISESEGSENDESSASASDQASASDPGPPDVVPKVTIKLGKPGTESEGKFYTEKHNVSKPNEDESKIKLKISQTEEKHDKIPKLTIKPVTKCENQQHSPKLTIKPLKPPENKELFLEHCETQPIPKFKITQESLSPKENSHIPKITIKPVLKTDLDVNTKNSKKLMKSADDDHIPVVTKLNIKPVIKPTDGGEISDCVEVPVVSKLNIKPLVKPKDNEMNSSGDDMPKVTKLTIKHLMNPANNSSELLTSEEKSTNSEDKSIPLVTKINIKPIIKPVEEDASKDSENQSSETGNSSDDNSDSIPVVTKLNIKPIVKPNDIDSSVRLNITEDVNIPIITKLNIKPILKPDENLASQNDCEQNIPENIPIVTKLNIKPVLKPEESEFKLKEQEETKNPPLVMKINIKAMTENSTADTESYKVNSIDHGLSNSLSENIPVVSKLTIKPIIKTIDSKELLDQRSNNTAQTASPPIRDRKHDWKQGKNNIYSTADTNSDQHFERSKESQPVPTQSKDLVSDTESSIPQTEKTQKDNFVRTTRSVTESKNSKMNELKTDVYNAKMSREHQISQNVSTSGCTLLKKLLEENPVKKVEEGHELSSLEGSRTRNKLNCENNVADNVDNSRNYDEQSSDADYNSYAATSTDNAYPTQEISSEEESKDLERPLEINITDKVTTSGQDSPRIILKINKTDHGASAKIITEEVIKHEDAYQAPENISPDDTRQSQRKLTNSKKKTAAADTPVSSEGKRLRSCRIVQEPEPPPSAKRGPGKRNTATPRQNKETEVSVLESKRLKLGQILSNKSISVSPVVEKITQDVQPDIQKDHAIRNSILLNDNRSKNGNSKLHKILSNLQAKQMQTTAHNDVRSDLTDNKILIPELDSTTTSTGSSDLVEIVPLENSRPKVQEMLINESSTSRDFNLVNDESARDPLGEAETELSAPLLPVEAPPSTPQPKKRGRPRKLPVSEGAKPVTTPALPTPALEERPQRSLRLSRDRPAILTKPRGRGRGGGRGAKRSIADVEQSPPNDPALEARLFSQERKLEELDPTSSRIKLPRMTEVLDKMPSSCSTPLSSRRRSSLVGDMKSFSEAAELKVVLDPMPSFEEVMKSPESALGRGGRGGRGSRGGRGGRGRPAGRSPRGRGRGRGGGRGAVYMKETMGIYGRVCGPATTTVQLFEEETCMMDDNATPSKPSHLLDEDSQSSVKSSTNDSSKLKKSKFAELFDSNKVWTAADVKEYMWPPADARSEAPVMMIQEQVAMFLGVKGFKRRYPELKRRPVGGEERDYVLRMGLVTEALCDLGITAVDASEVLDIMLSDYPHKYEEYRAHQRARAAQPEREPPPERVDRVEMKAAPPDARPDPPKVDPEKLKQEMAAAAIASASEWNARLNASRRGACVDLQTMTVHRRRAPQPPLPERAAPPAGLYPHALLPGQYQHWYRYYTPEELRYFPLNTALAAPPVVESPPESDSEPESDWGSESSDDETDNERSQGAKRRKLSKDKMPVKEDFSGIFSASGGPSGASGVGEAPTCRACGLREEANRKHASERFLACAQCLAKLHPSCLELGADTIRKCREYPWQCAECKTCCGCRLPQDDDKMLFCDLCDRGFHIYCVGLDKVPSGRWHCVECAVCKSCGAREASGLAGAAGGEVDGADWQHQSKRGPGGHKVYSHSLCAPCARAYRIGRYCPLCDRSFIGPKGTMQLVICKLCDRQLHQECVKATVSHLNVLDYTCGECRRGGITSRAAAARLAPRTIATLFMAKRRFNKYAHRQYLQSRQSASAAASAPPAPAEPAPPPDDESSDLYPEGDVSESDPLELGGAGEDTVVTVEGDTTAGEDTAPEDDDETAAAVKSLQMDFD